MDKIYSAAQLLRLATPQLPVLGLRPHAARRAAQWFLKNFPGKILFAVKANNTPEIVDAIYNAGIRTFDVASLAEVKQISAYADAELYLMNPIKSRRLIAEAYFDYGVRSYSLDSLSEFEKIMQETNGAKDLNLFVRVACDSKGAQIALDRKFGVKLEDASELLMAVRRSAAKLGITFHIGSQAMAPERYREALSGISHLIATSGVLPDMIDVGGGFPSIYPGMTPPPLSAYVAEITSAFERMNVMETCELFCEPGRALVAESTSVLTRVEHRRGQSLYLNDGSYGALYDAAHFNFVYPARLVRSQLGPFGALEPFSLYGPTCDSSDYMPGPFYLPGCIQEGDYIEFGQLGAYGSVMATQFNGFGTYEKVIFEDEPMMSMYHEVHNEEPVISLTSSAAVLEGNS